MLDESVGSLPEGFAEAFAEAGLDPREPLAEAPVERARDEHGRFAATEVVEEPVVDEAPVVPVVDEAEVLRQRLAEKDALLGKQSNEVGELRRQMDELRASLAQPVQQPQQNVYDPEQLDVWLDQNVNYLPQIAEQARQQGNDALFRQTVAKWREYDEFGPMEYLASVKAQEATAAIQAQLQQIAQPLVQSQREASFQQVVAEVQAKYPDFNSVIQVLDSNPGIAPKFLLDGVQSEDPGTRREALDSLYRYLKAEQVGTVRDTAQQAQQEAVRSTREEKILATVATGVTAPVADEKPASPQDVLISFWDSRLGDGWGKAPSA